MAHWNCDQCGYDLTGLSERGTCPECGSYYDVNKSQPSGVQLDHPFIGYLPAIAMGLLTVSILICGGLASLVSSKPSTAIGTAVVFAVVTGFATFVYAWTTHKDRRGE